MKMVKYKGKTIHPYESFYWNTTQEFFRGELGGGIARCVKCDDSLATLVMEERQQVMNIVDDTNIGFKNPQRGRVYSVAGLSPCLNCCEGGGLEPKVMEPMCSVHPHSHKLEFNPETSIKDIAPALRATDYKAPPVVYEPQFLELSNFISLGTQNNSYNRVWKVDNYCGALNCTKQMEILEPQVMTPKRTDFGKAIRKQYEQGNIQMSRHDMTELEPRQDGVSNTLTSVQKDNLVVEPKIIQKFGDRGTDQYSVRDIAHTIPANPMSDRGQMLLEPTEEYKDIDYEQITETNTRKILCVLQCKVGEEKIQWAVGRFVGIFKEEILRQRVYEESICECREYDTRLQPRTSLIKEDNVSTSRQRDGLRDMRSNQEYRCASQGFQLSEQFTREFNGIVSQLSHENTYAKECLQYLWKTCEGVQSMQQTLSALEEVWRPSSSTLEYIQPQKYRIRKLTCRECFRLMGVDDEDIDKIQASGISNSSQYKLAGNSIVVDVLYHIFRKAFIEKENESQQLTFF